MGLLDVAGRILANYLSRPSRSSSASIPTDPIALAKTVRAGDVLLVEGHQRISTAIKYLTQSTWSHAALCIGHKGRPTEIGPHFVEADAAEGVRIVAVGEFSGLSTRICRPIGLSRSDVGTIVSFVLERVGSQYDLRNVVDLARYLIPTPPVPVRWRRRMIAFGSGDPTKAICSTLIASAFQSIRYPILPVIYRELIEDPNCVGCVRDILHIRHHSLFTPRDFDVSPYFQIIKPTLEHGFDYRSLVWAAALDPSGGTLQ